MNQTVALFAGSFDPVTFGHLDVARRGARLFDRLIVGVGTNDRKADRLLPAEARVTLIRDELAGVDNIEVESFEGLAVEFARAVGAAVLLRSLRTGTDLDLESRMAATNLALAPELETVVLLARADLAHVSSGMVRECLRAGAEDLSSFVPGAVERYLRAHR